jgi:hypothetical protein
MRLLRSLRLLGDLYLGLMADNAMIVVFAISAVDFRKLRQWRQTLR